MCMHSDFNVSQNYGLCKKHTYEHLKHSDKERQLSIHEYGTCSSFEYDYSGGFIDSTWFEFLKGE